MTINGQPVKFVNEAEQVGVLRNTAGNLPNIMNRISSHTKAMSSILSADVAWGHHGNPQSSLWVQLLYGTPILFSGLAYLVLSKSEVGIVNAHYQKEAQYLRRQLTLFLVICHLCTYPLNLHGRHVLMTAPVSAKSWFQQIRTICLQYGLAHPLKMLDSPPSKASFKN